MLLSKTNSKEKRQKFHLYTPSGRISEPSGMCFYDGKIHIYYTFSPVSGIEKTLCAHVITEDFIKYTINPPVVIADSVFDKSGISGGSALSEKSGISLFYTGLVKNSETLTDNGKFEKNIVKTFSKDGFVFGKKRVLLTENSELLKEFAEISCPKVWQTAEGYFMMMGTSFEKKGGALIFFSHDLEKWHFYRKITGAGNMGEAWEYPDAFLISGAPVLSICVRNAKKSYTCGFCTLTENEAYGFQAIDFGTDFYAPQSFKDAKGRRIMLGIMGHLGNGRKSYESCFTVPRILTRKKGRIYQLPAEEITNLREYRRVVSLSRGERCDTFGGVVFEAIMQFSEEEYSVFLRDYVLIKCEKGTVTVTLRKNSVREYHSFTADDVKSVRVFSDVNSIEIFVDGKCFSALIEDSGEGGIYVSEGNLRGEIYKLSSYKID